MTFFSMKLGECPPDTTDDQLCILGGARISDVCSLNHHAREWGPYGLARWADTRALRQHWVDGAWVRVEATSADVAAFFQELGEAAPELDPSKRYLIEAEEF